jgi:MFS family permease
MTEVSAEGRPLAPPLYAVMTLSPGMMQGLVTVTLGYTLAHRGFTTGEIGALIGLFLLPTALRFVLGPLLDLVLEPRIWCLISIVASSVCAAVLAVTPLTRAALPWLAINVFALAVAGNILFTATAAALAVTTPDRERGAVAAWTTTGFLGGIGLGGALGLWLATHAGGFATAGLTLAGLTLACAAPLAILRTPAATGRADLRAHFSGLARAAAELARTRNGALAAILVTLPSGLGAAANLLPAVADDWRASADLVAGVTGVFGGLVSVPGAMLGGYLSDRFPRRQFYVATALAFSAVEAAMAFAPHTPLMFALFAPQRLCPRHALCRVQHRDVRAPGTGRRGDGDRHSGQPRQPAGCGHDRLRRPGGERPWPDRHAGCRGGNRHGRGVDVLGAGLVLARFASVASAAV